jgi:hypothetical protein
MAGRPTGSTGVKLTNEHRSKIQNSQILNRLISHAEGTVDMTPTQVQAGLGLLKKALPDLSAVTMDAKHDVSDSLADVLREVAARGGSLVKLDDDGDI